MFCPRLGAECLKSGCAAYSHPTYFTLPYTPKLVRQISSGAEFGKPIQFEMDVGFCKFYNQPMDGGSMARALTAELERGIVVESHSES